MNEIDNIKDISDEILNTNNNQPSIIPHPNLPSTHPLNSNELTSQQEDSQPSEGDYVKTISSESLLLSEGDNQRKRKRTSSDIQVPALSLKQKENIRNARKHIQTTSFDIHRMPEHNNKINSEKLFSKNTPKQINLRRSKRLQKSEENSTKHAFISTNQHNEADLLAFSVKMKINICH